MRAAVLTGIGASVPDRVVTNEDLCDHLDTTDEWIRTRTGIAARRFVDPGVTTVDLATRAAEYALKSAGADAADFVLLATATPDRLCPASAPEVAWRLGLSRAAACDVSAVCSGFVYALATGCGYIAAGIASSVLVIGADTFSTIVDPKDRSTAVIFGDGAGAVLLRAGSADEPGAIGPSVLGSDGEHAEWISRSSSDYLAMQGQPVYRRAVQEMTECSRQALAKAGWEPSQVDAFVGHQANQRILDAAADRVGIPDSARVGNIARVGNTAAASIPLALADAAASRRLTAGDRVLLTAFGGGLTWAATTLTWPDVPAVLDLPIYLDDGEAAASVVSGP